MPEELKFPETHLQELMASFDRGKAQGVVEYIGGFGTIEERKALYRLAQRTIGRAEKPDLDSLTVVVNAAIADLLDAAKLARDSGGAADSNALTDGANAFSYNLAADLAECWPGDNTPRTQHHFEVGLSAAQNCLKWRNELNKGPASFAMAWWAKGVHALSLGEFEDSAVSFRESLRFSEVALQEKEEKPQPNTDFGCVLASGYLGLALAEAGDPHGPAMFSQACETFTAQLSAGGEVAEDAKVGLEQLRTIQSRIRERAS